jgi:phospholipid/cholesterol/gamma-HCH transport system permease protein
MEAGNMATPPELQFQRAGEDTLTVGLAGSWKLGQALPSAAEVRRGLSDVAGVDKIDFDSRQLTGWDSGLLVFLTQVNDVCTEKGISIDASGLPQGAKKLLTLAAAVPEKKDARKAAARVPFLVHVGNETVGFFKATGELLEFIGDAVLAFGNLLMGRAQYRKSDLWLLMEACGGQALPIVSLISFLVGSILAFVGAIQLQMFGAQIFVADLVGIAMVRLMAAIMTGIVMAGRTGGAFAAQLGTMQVNQEIDALKTLGISPMQFLVLPRMLALAVMMPLLCLYANFMGILGGMVVGVGMLDIGLVQYYNQTVNAVNLWNLGIGLFSGVVFGLIVALSGCMRGMQCGRSASAVGDAATSAVVTAIVGIIVSTAVITVLCNMLGI